MSLILQRITQILAQFGSFVRFRYMTMVSAPSQEEFARLHSPPVVEHAVVAAALSGDEAAFEELIRIYGRRVYMVAYAIVQDSAEAEDIVQETFLKVHQGRTRDVDAFGGWLMTVTRNAARDRLRRRKPQADEEIFQTLPDLASATPGEEMQRQELRSNLRRALGKLPEEHRIALTLRYLEGKDHRAIEQAMGVSNGALRGILGRALGTLRRMPALAQERIRP